MYTSSVDTLATKSVRNPCSRRGFGVCYSLSAVIWVQVLLQLLFVLGICFLVLLLGFVFVSKRWEGLDAIKEAKTHSGTIKLVEKSVWVLSLQVQLFA